MDGIIAKNWVAEKKDKLANNAKKIKLTMLHSLEHNLMAHHVIHILEARLHQLAVPPNHLDLFYLTNWDSAIQLPNSNHVISNSTNFSSGKKTGDDSDKQGEG